MKKLLLIIALMTSVLLISCSESINEPVKDDANKSLSYLNQFPYDFLQSFEEVEVLEWQSPTSRDNQLNIRINRNIEEIEDIFVLVTYGNPLTDDEGMPVLYFVDHSMGDIKLTLDMDSPVKYVKAFVKSKVTENEIIPPYANAQRFNKVESTYEIIEDEIIISAQPWTPDIAEVYALIHKMQNNELIYLQLPVSNEKIIIPDYDVGEVTGITLFVKSNPYK